MQNRSDSTVCQRVAARATRCDMASRQEQCVRFQRLRHMRGRRRIDNNPVDERIHRRVHVVCAKCGQQPTNAHARSLRHACVHLECSGQAERGRARPAAARTRQAESRRDVLFRHQRASTPLAASVRTNTSSRVHVRSRLQVQQDTRADHSVVCRDLFERDYQQAVRRKA